MTQQDKDDLRCDVLLPADMREAIRQGMGAAPSMGYANPFGVQRRDAQCHDPRQVARDHFDRYGIVRGVLRPPGMTAFP